MLFRNRPPSGSPKPFADRRHAGRILADRLTAYARRTDVIVLGLPRGGVPVAYEVASALGAPLDVFIVRKLGVPGHEELAMGAVASGDISIVSREIIADLGITDEDVRRTTVREIEELHRRERLYRDDLPAPDLAGKVVIVVDDGLATGATMMAALASVRRLGPARLVVAVPVAPKETRVELERVADEVVVAQTPEPFFSVGAWYQDFTQTSDDEVRRLLADAKGDISEISPSGS